MRRRGGVAVVVLLLTVAAGLRLVRLGWPDLVGGDEGYYGTYARNLLEGGLEQWLNLGREPLSAPDNKPFLFPALLAVAVALAGPTGWALRSVPALAGFVAAALAGLLVRRRFGAAAGWSATIAMLLLPPLVYASRVVMGEGILVAFGLAGTWAAVRALEEDRSGLAWIAGALWGCGFLVKLWLVGLYIAPVVLALLCSRRRFAPAPWGRLVLAAGAFVLVGGAHLFLVALLSPATMPHWIEQYFIFSLFGRASGQEFAAYWHQPWSFYLRATLQTCFMAWPLAVVALTQRAEAAETEERSLPQLVLWGALAGELLLVSFMGVKLRQYSFPLLPGLATLAGIGAATLLRRPERVRPAAAAALTAAALLPLAAWQLAATPLFPSRTMAAAVALTLAASALLLAFGGGGGASRRRLAFPTLVGAMTLAAVAGSALTVQRECLGHRTGYREAAAAVAPYLAERTPTDAAFLAPELRAFQFLLFRSGRYWATPYEARGVEEQLALAADPRFAAFVTTDRADLYGGATPPAVVDWLAAHQREITAEVERSAGRSLPIRVFVHPLAAPGAPR